MNPDPQDDWLDRALMSREAMKPPPGFTRAVMQRIATARPPGAISTFLAEEGVRLGVALATVGFLSIVDINEVGHGLSRTLPAPDAAVVAAVAFCVGWLVLSRRADEA